jgi:hypothetical protein
MDVGLLETEHLDRAGQERRQYDVRSGMMIGT